MATQYKYEVWVAEEFDDLFMAFIRDNWPGGVLDYDFIDSMEA